MSGLDTRRTLEVDAGAERSQNESLIHHAQGQKTGANVLDWPKLPNAGSLNKTAGQNDIDST